MFAAAVATPLPRLMRSCGLNRVVVLLTCALGGVGLARLACLDCDCLGLTAAGGLRTTSLIRFASVLHNRCLDVRPREALRSVPGLMMSLPLRHRKDRKMALMQLASVDEAIEALIALHDHLLDQNQHLRVSFSKSTI